VISTLTARFRRGAEQPHPWVDAFGCLIGRLIASELYASRMTALEIIVSDKSPVKTATEARQGQTTGVVRWVLAISLALAIVAMIVAYFIA
jgi:hypothetical protein